MSVTERSSPVAGLSRREFLSYCGVLAASIGLSGSAIPEIAAALEAAVKRPVVVWSDFQECAGCTVALLQTTGPTPAQLLLNQIALAYNEIAMAAAGYAIAARLIETGRAADTPALEHSHGFHFCAPGTFTAMTHVGSPAPWHEPTRALASTSTSRNSLDNAAA